MSEPDPGVHPDLRTPLGRPEPGSEDWFDAAPRRFSTDEVRARLLGEDVPAEHRREYQGRPFPDVSGLLDQLADW